MRALICCSGILLFAFTSSAVAEASPRQSLDWGLSYGYQGLALRKTLSENTLAYLGVNYGKSSFESHTTSASAFAGSGTGNLHTYSASAGVRLYLANEKLSDFIQMELDESYTKDDFGTSVNSYSTTMGYGLEYFLDSRVSVEARAGVRYTYSRTDTSLSTNSTRSTSIPVVGIALTRYW